MAISDLWSRRGKGRESNQTSLDELLRDYDLVSVNDEPGQQFMVVTEKAMQLRAGSEMREIGSSSPSPWTSFNRQEYNPALQGIKGLEIYDKMRRSDGTVRGTLRSIKTPALSGRWFIEPAGDEPLDKEIADFVWKNLTEYMTISWPQVLTEALLMCDFGYYMFEKVWENRVIDGNLRTVLSKLAPRHPMDVQDWVFDSHGGPKRVLMNPPTTSTTQTAVPIDIEKLIVFTFDREAGNIEGISVLRSAYKHWYYIEQLYKIDAIQKERHAIGIPVIKLPVGYKPEDKAAADELGRNIRTNERAHVVLPPNWDILMLKLEGNVVDALDSVEHHQGAIRENILVNFIEQGAREEDLTMFLKASRFVADIVASTFNLYLIKQMVKYNWPDYDKCPQMKVRRIGESADWRTLSFALRNLIGAGVIIPDGALEVNLRDEMDLPAPDEDTARLIATPQNPFDTNEDDLQGDGEVDDRVGEDPSDAEGDRTRNNNNPNYNRKPRPRRRRAPGRKQNGQVAGLPRQSLPSRQRNAFGLPGKQGGRDRSGG